MPYIDKVGIAGSQYDIKDTTGTFIAPQEASPATADHAVGAYLVYNGALYRVSSAIAIGDTLTVGTNIEAVPDGIGGEVTELKSQLDEKAPAIFVESDDAFSHSDVNIANRITFKGNAYAFKKARYVNAKNYYPKYEYTRTLANNSVSVVCTDGFCIYNGTATGTNGLSGNDVIVSIPAGTYKLFIEILSDNSTVVAKNHTFRFVCSDGTTKSVTVSLGIDDVAVNDVTFTSDVVKFNRTYEVRTNNVYDNYVMWFGLYKLEAVMTDTELTVPSDGEAEYESIIAATDIDTMQHKSIINHITDTKEYVDGHIPSDMLTESDLVYITPEMYGAIGDGVADDTSAVNACITETSRYGDTRNKPVRGYGKYKVTESIRIGGYYLDIFLKSIVYTGDDAALIISGKNSKFEFNEIIATTGTNAVGLRLLCTNDSSVPFAGFDSNLVNVTQRISANGNGMELIREDSATEGFYYNTINVHKIASVSANCMYGDANANFAEIDIYGQAMSAPNGYLYYANRESATGVCLHNMCIEQNVKNGIFRGAALFNCRTAECMNHYTEAEPDRGRIFVLEGVKTGELYADEHSNVLLLAVNADNATTYEQMVESVKDYYDETGDRNAWAAIYGYATIEPKVLHLCNGVAESGFGGTTVTRPSGKIIIYYNHVGFVPDNDFYKKITDANYTIELLRTPISARNYYTPTIFDIDVADCQIHLDWSYCCYGINEFRVIQYADKRAKIYDKYGNLMFDGSTHDAGTYVFRCHRTAWEGITFRDGTKMTWVDFSTPYKVYTGSNEEWVIEKLDIVS